MVTGLSPRRLGAQAARKALRGSLPSVLVAELVENRVAVEPSLAALYESMTDEQARLHFGAEEPLESEHLRRGVRYFHAWRVQALRERIGARLATARFLDVGDTDGLMLKHLGKQGLGFNLAPAAIANIRANGIDAQLGDGQELPFDDGSFDFVLCFETLEHVESPAQLLGELARVCAPDGRVFVSIPWVPRTYIHPRDPNIPRGYAHVFEFARDDFSALVSHTPLEIRSEDVCNVLGPPSRPVHRAFLAATHRSHLVAGMFRRFQFFELAPGRGAGARGSADDDP
jgi:SAM-dependent methyltransferase